MKPTKIYTTSKDYSIMTNSNVNPKAPPQFIYITPEDVATDNSLSGHDLRIYMIVNSFTYTRGHTYMSNDCLSKKLGVTSRSVIRSINKLCSKKYIIREEINGHRYLRVPIGGVVQKCNEDMKILSGGGDKSVTEGCQPCHPIKQKIIKQKINNKTTTTTQDSRKNTKASSSDFVISKKEDDKLLKLRDECLKGDERTDEEFLKQGLCKIEENANKYTRSQRVKGLETIIRSGVFETPKGYKASQVPKEIDENHEKAYQDRMNGLRRKVKEREEKTKREKEQEAYAAKRLFRDISKRNVDFSHCYV